MAPTEARNRGGPVEQLTDKLWAEIAFTAKKDKNVFKYHLGKEEIFYAKILMVCIAVEVSHIKKKDLSVKWLELYR